MTYEDRPCSVCGVPVARQRRRFVGADGLYHECDLEAVRARLYCPPMTERAIAAERGEAPVIRELAGTPLLLAPPRRAGEMPA